jgi:hypothetical protein
MQWRGAGEFVEDAHQVKFADCGNGGQLLEIERVCQTPLHVQDDTFDGSLVGFDRVGAMSGELFN